MSDPTRRTILAIAAAAACACAGSGCPLLAGAADASPPGPVDVGPLENFAPEGVADRWAAAAGFFVVSRGGRVYAVSSRCTHKAVRLVAARGGEGFKCPRHGSTFDDAGHVTRSPARKALAHFAIRLSDARHVIVDPSKPFAEKDWDDPASYVPVVIGRRAQASSTESAGL
jgi:thiosulfate dehydrogenase [quinone] large subunit